MANLMTDRRKWISLASALSRTGGVVVDQIVPPTCLACDCAVGANGHLCGDCWARLQILEKPYCPVMGTPFDYDSGSEFVSLAAIADPPDFDRCRSAVIYDDVARRLAQGLKFADRTDLAPWLARWMVRAGAELLEPGITIVPVPLHRWRMIKRRFNQSAELARHVAKLSGGDFRPEVLQRIRSTRQQVGLGAKERQRNVLGAFRVPTEMEIHVRSKRVLLIDDVYTTGATLQACARALRRKGAAGVDCLTFARVFNGQ